MGGKGWGPYGWGGGFPGLGPWVGWTFHELDSDLPSCQAGELETCPKQTKSSEKKARNCKIKS